MASAPRPFSIRIFLPQGTPEGLRVIERSNWTGCGIYCPRALFAEVRSREEFERTGVYVLYGPPEQGDLPTIYVGEGDPVRPRLDQHHSKKDFWTWCLFFTAKDGSLNKAHVQHLEARLIELAASAKRAKLDNHTAPQRPALSEAEIADVESFLADMLSICPLVGLTAFERPATGGSPRTMLHLHGRGARARGYESAEGFVVCEGSEAAMDEVESMEKYIRYAVQLRNDLKEQGVLVQQENVLRLTQDYVFGSPSTAAAVMLGRNSNGRTAWRTEDGRSLRELQEADAGSA